MFGINNVLRTYGYITKNNRIENKLPKDHHIDARMISGNLLTEENDKVYIFQKVRRHNRKIYKDKILKEGKKKLNQGSYTIKGFHRYDVIKYKKEILYINGLRKIGSFMYKSLSDKTFVTNKTCNKIKLIQHRGGFIIK
jgi:N6-L-threonylcarbamoyladenine synthase